MPSINKIIPARIAIAKKSKEGMRKLRKESCTRMHKNQFRMERRRFERIMQQNNIKNLYSNINKLTKTIEKLIIDDSWELNIIK